MIRPIAAVVLAALSAVAAAQAPANPPVRIRGTVESIDGQNLTVKARNGESMKVTLADNMRGTGEGHYDWDLRPESKMTNANVANVEAMASDRVMTVQYKGGEKKILVTPKTVVVSYAPADRSELKPGAPVFVNAQRQPDGTLSAPRVNVGLHGQVPPM